MSPKILDADEMIHRLMDIIQSLCDEHELNKDVVIDDFIYTIKGDKV